MSSSNDEYTRLLAEAFDGERLGVVLGRELATRAKDPKERAVYSAFERVETIARNQLEPMISSAELTNGLQRDDAIEQQGAELARQMVQQPRADAWAGILPEFEKFIGHLERLRELAPADSRRPCDILVEHEVASVAMVGALIDGDLDRATNALEEFITTV